MMKEKYKDTAECNKIKDYLFIYFKGKIFFKSTKMRICHETPNQINGNLHRIWWS